jgi:hypothetical protein
MTEGTTIDNSLAGRTRAPRTRSSAELSATLPQLKQTVLPPKPEHPAAIPESVIAEIDAWLPEGFARKPFGAHVQKLTYPERPGFHRHWFNDYPGRISKALEAGYKHVTDANGRNVSRIVGVGQASGGLTAFLMEIPEVYWRQDQAAKDAERDKVDAKIRRGIAAQHIPGQDGAYLPRNQAGTEGPDIKVNGR